MNPLVFLWQFSLALCGFAATVLLLLLLARLLSARSDRRRAALRRELLPLMLGGAGEIRPLRGVRLQVATALTGELAELTRGSDREAMLQRAAAIGVTGLLRQQLHARSAQTRLTAVETLALFKKAGAQVRIALDDRNPAVRLGAALALAQRDDGPSPQELIEKLMVGTRERSLLLVSMMADLAQRDAGAVAALLVERDIPSDAKVAAIEALSDNASAYAPLLASIAHDTDGDPELRPRLYRALGRSGHPAGRQAIVDGLESEAWEVRAAAAQAAGRARLRQAAERLRELLSDDNWWVRYRAGEALLRLGPQGLDALHRASAGDDVCAREAASAIMAERLAA